MPIFDLSALKNCVPNYWPKNHTTDDYQDRCAAPLGAVIKAPRSIRYIVATDSWARVIFIIAGPAIYVSAKQVDVSDS